MIRYWLLSAEDIEFINQRRRDHNRLGFAVQLCLLRYPGWPLSPEKRIPDNLVTFVAQQLAADPNEMILYPTWAETRREHLLVLSKQYGFRQYQPPYPSMLRQQLRTQALSTDSVFTLVQSAMEWLRERKVILPALATLEPSARIGMM